MGRTACACTTLQDVVAVRCVAVQVQGVCCDACVPVSSGFQGQQHYAVVVTTQSLLAGSGVLRQDAAGVGLVIECFFIGVQGQHLVQSKLHGLAARVSVLYFTWGN